LRRRRRPVAKAACLWGMAAEQAGTAFLACADQKLICDATGMSGGMFGAVPEFSRKPSAV
jgi:hypothetical protein